MPRRNSASRGRFRQAVRHDAPRDFRCAGCRLQVPAQAPGTAHRNHCPHCLSSSHVDRDAPGDRAADCGGRMDAVSVTTRPDGEWMIIHQCRSCEVLSANRIAGDDNALALMRLAVKPLRDSRVPRDMLLSL